MKDDSDMSVIDKLYKENRGIHYALKTKNKINRRLYDNISVLKVSNMFFISTTFISIMFNTILLMKHQ